MIGIICRLFSEFLQQFLCPAGDLLSVTLTPTLTPSFSFWKLPSVKIGYNSDKCYWYAEGTKSLAKPFQPSALQWYQDSKFATISGSGKTTRLFLQESSSPSGTIGTLYLFVHPANMPNLRILTQKNFYPHQLKKCKDDDDDENVPPASNDIFGPPPSNCTTPPCEPGSPWIPERGPPGAGFGDPQCLSFDGFRFECNFLGEVVWTRRDF